MRVMEDIVGWHRVSTVQLVGGVYETAVFKRDEWQGNDYDYANPVFIAQFINEKESLKAHRDCIKSILDGMKGCNPKYKETVHVYGDV